MNRVQRINGIMVKNVGIDRHAIEAVASAFPTMPLTSVNLVAGMKVIASGIDVTGLDYQGLLRAMCAMTEKPWEDKVLGRKYRITAEDLEEIPVASTTGITLLEAHATICSESSSQDERDAADDDADIINDNDPNAVSWLNFNSLIAAEISAKAGKSANTEKISKRPNLTSLMKQYGLI